MSFKKMSGAGNDFIVVDDRSGEFSRLEPETIRKLCGRQNGVGADGLILIGPDSRADFFMTYYNRDGHEAELCANGARCSVLFAHSLDPQKSEFVFRSRAGDHRGKLAGGREAELVEIELPPPCDIALDQELEIDGTTFAYDYIVVGVPHIVILREDGLDDLDVVSIGRRLRRHERFAPRGTNVNFVRVYSRHSLALRTYERGVEEETLACGTGSSASAVVTTLRGRTTPPVECRTRGGDVLTVSFAHEGTSEAVRTLRLLGPAVITFEGWVEL
jgi:diaminopimelate epimerase